MRNSAVTLLAACAAACLAAGSAHAQTSGLDQLEQICIDDGSNEATCGCLRGFVSENFSQREIDGAALVLGMSESDVDVPTAFASLLAAGYEPDEMLAIYNRIVELEDEARQTCEDPGAAPRPTLPEEAAEEAAAAAEAG